MLISHIGINKQGVQSNLCVLFFLPITLGSRVYKLICNCTPLCINCLRVKYKWCANILSQIRFSSRASIWMMLYFSLVFHASFSKVNKNLIVDLRMSAYAVIKHLNILKRHALCFRSVFEFVVMQTFGFQCAK